MAPLRDEILAVFIKRAESRYQENISCQRNTLGAFISSELKRLAPCILTTLEAAADWQKDPLEAARRSLRDDMAAKTKAEAEAQEARIEEETKAEVRKRTEALLSGLQSVGK